MKKQNLKIHRFAVACMICLIMTPQSVASPPDQNLIRDSLKRMWDSVETVEIHGESFVCDSSGQRKQGSQTHFQQFDFFFGSGGRGALKLVSVAPDGRRTPLQNIRQDGKRLITITPFQDDPESVDSIHVQPQIDAPDHHGTFMNNLAFWLWCPFGRPAHVLFDHEVIAETGQDENGHEIVILRNPKKNFRCELDPSHNWLPLKLELEGQTRFTATQFTRDNGIWFPSAGTQLRLHSGSANEAQQMGFQVRVLRVNRGVAPATFSVPTIPAGAAFRDQVTGKKYLKGGDEARDRLLAQHPVKQNDSRVNDDPGSSVITVREHSWFSWGAFLGCASIALLIAAWFFRPR